MIRFLSRILFYFSSFSILPPSKKKQQEILSWAKARHQNAPEFLRNSLRQYDCHTRYFLGSIWFGFNLFSITAVVPLFLILLLRSFKGVGKQSAKQISLFQKIPEEIRDKFGPQFVNKPFGYLRSRDLKFVIQILLFGWSRPYFLFRSIWKIAVYSELIDTYQPEKIWVTQEMVFESSLLTNYLDSFGIRHVNFMHGVNYFSIQMAFSSFHDFYIWDEYYILLFKSLYVEVEEYHLFSPLARKPGVLAQKNILKYYGQHSSDKKNFEKIVDNLLVFARSRNCSLSVRLHPLHKQQFEIDILNRKQIPIESNKVNLTDSLGEALYVCSEFSTVLYEAYLMKCKIVIDNTFPDRIKRLKELDVIFFDKLPHEFLVQQP